MKVILASLRHADELQDFFLDKAHMHENLIVEDCKIENEIVEVENKVEILARQNLGFANWERPAAAAIWVQNWSGFLS